MKYPNLSSKTVKLLEENIGQKLHDTGPGNDFLDMRPKGTGNRRKNSQI